MVAQSPLETAKPIIQNPAFPADKLALLKLVLAMMDTFVDLIPIPLALRLLVLALALMAALFLLAAARLIIKLQLLDVDNIVPLKSEPAPTEY